MPFSFRPFIPEDRDTVADVFIAARAGMTYLPALHTEADTRAYIHALDRTHDICVCAVSEGDSRISTSTRTSRTAGSAQCRSPDEAKRNPGPI